MFDKEFKNIFDYAKGKVDDVEILLVAGQSFSTRIHKQKVETFDYANSQGISVRVLQNGKSGYAYTENFEEDALQKTVDMAIMNVQVIETKEFEEIGDYENVKNEPKVYEPKLDDVSVDEKIELVKKMEQLAYSSDKRIINVPYASYADSKSIFKIANSKGLDKEDIQNYAYCFLGVLSEDNEEKRMGMDFQITRDFETFDPELIVKNAVERSISLLNSEPIKSGTYPVIFNNDMTSTLLGTFITIFNAKSVLEGKSLLKGKIDEKIANEMIQLYDDGLKEDGFNTSAFDSEGYPSQKTKLIENGVLKSYLHNTHTAKMFNTKSTGNGSRPYKSSLDISSTNFYLQEGNYTREELLNSYPEVIEIVGLQGMHSGANPISGDFSLSAEGFLYKNGKKQHSLQPFTISGNILQIFQSVEKIADDFRFNMSGVGAASTLVSSISVSG